ncbi:hypothetical protein [Flammeovirga sp. EKP202]|uniref:hypothetical protein n=1 Tax=Flammeovirga sp. EKP202 TaxID=2770592 RepID=UPI00165F2344|nr:hypothetical protein [Flammeovirga sp. EKP202]MBD0404583.1 hypothetical protein [Flammeovirga sp. EKP202]
MWSRIKKIIHHKLSTKEILKNTSLQLEQESEHLYHLQMSLKAQVITLKGKSDHLQKHIKKNQFDIKAAISNEQRSKALELNNYGNTLKKERDHYVKSIKELELKLLDTSSKISVIQIQKEKISTQLIFLKTNQENDSFDVEDFLYDVFNTTEESTIPEDELLSMEIDLALEQNREDEESEEKIQQFFEEIHPNTNSHSTTEESKENMINSFFTRTKPQTAQEKKIDDFFNKK